MPYESPEQAEQRRAAKAERARELAAHQRELDEAIQARLLLALSAQYVRGYDELATLLRVSPRAAQEIAARPGFPAAVSPTGDRIRLWKTSAVMNWLDAQGIAR